MKRNTELRYLLFVLLVLNIGFLLLGEAFLDRNIPAVIDTPKGALDISPALFSAFPNSLIPTFFSAAFILFHIFLRIRLPEADPLLLPVTAFLSGVGLIMMLRLSPDLALLRSEQLFNFAKRHPDAVLKDNIMVLAQLGIKQTLFVIAGILTAIIATMVFSFQRISSKKYIWVLFSVILTLTTLLFGKTINGKTLWLWGVQPIEFIKLLLILFLAGYVYEQGKGIEAARSSTSATWFRYCGPMLIMFLFAMLPIFIQKDLGPTFLLVWVFLIMFHFAGNKPIISVAFIFMVATVGYISYKTGYPSIVHERFNMLFDPFGRSESLSRALWSTASGGFFGTGIGYGEPYRISEVQSDFMFTAICEEMGLTGALAVVCAYAVFIARCIKIAISASNPYIKGLITGIETLFAIQTFIIMGGNLMFIPLTGITLPLAVSYGGSSTVMNFIAVGILLKVSGESA